MNKKLWIIGYLAIVLFSLSFIAYKTYELDPFFHYHKPDTGTYNYRLNSERNQNDGIIRHFDYTGLITGTSMAENFRASEAESLWGGTFIKVPFSGASFKEINDNLKNAASRNKDLKIVIRSLEPALFGDDKDRMRNDMGDYPLYLYDEDPLNDVKYLFNRDTFFYRVYPMLRIRQTGSYPPGITTFDSYVNWMSPYKFGKNAVYPGGLTVGTPKEQTDLSEKEIYNIRANIRQNVTALADEYPDITFYCFFTPYSAGFWLGRVSDGRLQRQIQSERIVIEEILGHENIKLFSFNCCFEITTDLNHYKDPSHYAEWINSLILKRMHDGVQQLTEENYEQYLQTLEDFYLNYDFSELMDTPDYENDYYAAALLEREISGIDPNPIDLRDPDTVHLSGAETEDDRYNGEPGVICTGTLQRAPEQSIPDYMFNTEYIGARITIDDITPYKYLVYEGRNIRGSGRMMIVIYSADGEPLLYNNQPPRNEDHEWHQFLFRIQGLTGPAVIILNGSDTYTTGDPDSQYEFSGITLY